METILKKDPIPLYTMKYCTKHNRHKSIPASSGPAGLPGLLWSVGVRAGSIGKQRNRVLYMSK